MSLAQDLFTRTISTPPGGWGTADVGGTYTTVDAVDRLSVVPGAGRMTVTPSANASALLRSVSSTRVVYRASLSSSASYAMAGANQSFSLIARGVTITSSSQTAYLARVRIETGNILRLYIIRKLAGVETPIGSAHSISLPQGYTPGQKIWCEVSVLDTNPTTLGAKMWLDGSSEPSLYQVQGTDTTPELQAAGTVGIQTYLSGTATTSITASYHSLSIAEPGKPNLMVNSQQSNITWQVMQNGTPVDVKRWYVMQGGAPVLLKEGEVEEVAQGNVPNDPALYGPKRYTSLDEMITELGLPLRRNYNVGAVSTTHADYIMWDDAVAIVTAAITAGDLPQDTDPQDLWTVSKALMPASHLDPAPTNKNPDIGRNVILVLPERTDGNGDPIPYMLDGSRGFMASGVAWVTGPNYEQNQPDGNGNGGGQPIHGDEALWMELARAPRGIVGLGPNAVIGVKNPKVMKKLPAPIMKTEQQSEAIYGAPGVAVWPYRSNGQRLSDHIVGNPYGLISAIYSNPVWANFELRTGDFGDVAYGGLKTGTSKSSITVKRLFLNKCWRGDSGVPNDETGAISFNGGTVRLEHLRIDCPTQADNGLNTTVPLRNTTRSSSPVMWNNNTGGTAKYVQINGDVHHGMTTLWRCRGVFDFEHFQFKGSRSTCLNIEDHRWDLAGGLKISAKNCDFAMHRQYNQQGTELAGNHIQIKSYVNGSNRGSVNIWAENYSVSGGRGYVQGALNAITYEENNNQKVSYVQTPGARVSYNNLGLNPSLWDNDMNITARIPNTQHGFYDWPANAPRPF